MTSKGREENYCAGRDDIALWRTRAGTTWPPTPVYRSGMALKAIPRRRVRVCGHNPHNPEGPYGICNE
jgi:hypothetical protein